MVDYIQVICEGSYVGKSQYGSNDIYRLNDQFLFVNRFTGECFKVDDDILFQHMAGKKLCEPVIN
jgi:hypothetical protein